MSEDVSWLIEYERLLKAPGRYQDALAVKASRFPTALFKYREVNGNNLDALLRDYVWAGAPRLMNDPYDSYCTADWAHLDRILVRKNFRKSMEKLDPPFSEQEIERFERSDDPMLEAAKVFLERAGGEHADKAPAIIEVLAQAVRKNIAEVQAATSDMARFATKIASFSTIGTDTRMWAHYTASHKGYCVEYDFRTLAADDMRLRHLYPVLYSTTIVDVTALVEPAITIGPNDLTIRWAIIAASYKHESWRHEKEWRLIHTVGDPAPGIALLVPTPRAVYLGMDMTAENADLVTKIAKDKGAAIYRMQRGNDPAHLVPVRATE